MKKYDLLKVLGISLLITFFLSWVIPAGTFSSGSFVSSEATNPLGLYDLFKIPVYVINRFVQYVLLFLAIGGFYGVLNKSGVYSKIVEDVVGKYKTKRKTFLIISIVLFSLLSSVLGLSNVILILVPFFVTVLLKLEFSKINSLAATIGAMLVGQIGSLIGLGTWGYLTIIFSQLDSNFSMFSMILVRLVFFAIITFLYVLLVSKNTDKKEKNSIPLYSDYKTKKSTLPMIVVFSIMFILLVLGLYNLSYTFDITFLEDFHSSLIETEIGGYALFSNLIGSGSALGLWGVYDVITILIIFSIIIAWLYNVKMKDFIEGFISGMKEMLKPAIYATLACVVFEVILNLGGTDFVNTIVNKLAGENFTMLGTTFATLVSSLFYNDFYTLIATMATPFSTFDANVMQIIAFTFQVMFGLVMLIAPTSIFLFAGLSYLEISYKEWVKYIYKYVLIVFGIFIWIAIMINVIIPFISNLI